MSQSSVVNERNVAGEAGRRVLLAGIGLVSFASLLLELALTRLFSVVLFYHFAFLAISLALLGLGAGGVFAYLRRNWLAHWDLRRLAGVICALNAAAIMTALWVVLHVPVSLSLRPMNILRLTAIYLAAGVPFFFTGLLFSVVFARASRWVTQLYGTDLIGGALACLAVVPLLNWLGGPNAVVCAALVMAMAAAIWAGTGTQHKIAIGMAAVLVMLVAANHSERFIDVVYAKGMRNVQPWVEFARWNTISRVEVDDSGEGNGKWIRIDSDAATVIMNSDPHNPASSSYLEQLARSPAVPNGWVANVLRPRGDYAVIGPGGGIDVLRALASGSTNVTGIEINPIIATTIMRERYADYAHHLYDLPQVHIHVSDGRSWIRSSRDRYDVIQMTLVDTWASTAAGAFALSENNLYTVEAFREYFDHLKPDGFIAITRWEFARPREALRVVSQAIEVLRKMGVEDVRKYFIVVASGQLNQDGQPVTVLAKKTPFTVEEERAVLEHVRATPNFYPLYTPYVYGRPNEDVACAASALSVTAGNCIEAGLVRLAEQRRAPSEAVAPFDRLINLPWRGEADGKEFSPRGEYIHNYPFDIAPVSDNAPFFFFTFKTGSALRTLLAHQGRGNGVDWKNNLGLLVLGVLLIISIVAVLAFLVGPMVLHRGAPEQHFVPLLYFVAIGLGYILVEIALIQRFVLFLGHPTYALTVVVFLMLLSSGAGSVVSRRWLGETLRVRRVLLAIVGVVALYIFLLQRLLESLVALPFPSKLLLSGALLAPLGFLMGMPFPTGLRAIVTKGRSALQTATLEQFSEPPAANSAIEWAWAMNAASSVLGSALAMVVAVHSGLNAALACAAGAYLSAAALTALWQRS